MKVTLESRFLKDFQIKERKTYRRKHLRVVYQVSLEIVCSLRPLLDGFRHFIGTGDVNVFVGGKQQVGGFRNLFASSLDLRTQLFPNLKYEWILNGQLRKCIDCVELIKFVECIQCNLSNVWKIQNVQDTRCAGCSNLLNVFTFTIQHLKQFFWVSISKRWIYPYFTK